MDLLRKKLSFSKSADTQRNYSIRLILKGMVIAFLFSLISFLILSLLLTLTNISEGIIKPTSYIVMIISIVIGSGFVAQRIDKKGWMHGAITGLLYIIILTIIGIFTGEGLVFGQLFLSRIIIGIVAGGIGGILGINLK